MGWMAVALGGALGSVVRHAVNQAASARWPAFPVGTIIVNVVGCFVVGLLAGLAAGRQVELPRHGRELVFVGFLGGFTTFSAFSLDTLALARTNPLHAALNVGVQVAGSLVGVWLGYRCGTAMR